MKAVIMAGGGGTRLWPVSRKFTPKQSQPFGDNETLLQKTYRRLRRGWPNRDIFVSTLAEQYGILKKQLPKIAKRQYLLEPCRRDTAAAVGLVATYLHHHDPQAVMFTANSDAYIKEADEYIRVIKAAGRMVERSPSQTVLVGIKPRYPDTGLGYIKLQKQIDTIGRYEVFKVDRFVEKPDLATAKRYAASWQYLWNPAMFVFRVDAMLDKFRRWLPDHYQILMKIDAAIGTSRETTTLKKYFPRLKKISIDYGIMEKDRAMLVIPANLTWADIGNWRAVHEVLSSPGETKVLGGLHVHRDSRGNLIYAPEGKVIATAGLSDMIIIDTPDALLVIPKDRAQEVKELVIDLEARAMHRYL